MQCSVLGSRGRRVDRRITAERHDHAMSDNVGVSENRGEPYFGGSYNKDPTILGYHIRVPYFRKHQKDHPAVHHLSICTSPTNHIVEMQAVSGYSLSCCSSARISGHTPVTSTIATKKGSWDPSPRNQIQTRQTPAGCVPQSCRAMRGTASDATILPSHARNRVSCHSIVRSIQTVGPTFTQCKQLVLPDFVHGTHQRLLSQVPLLQLGVVVKGLKTMHKSENTSQAPSKRRGLANNKDCCHRYSLL